ncbi:MAG: hypothetical protein GF368_05490 [Candidatus Aenigmarchaeota archaeon]|nr:hypothetical protein [Candidatus Aenigmarchaeota archaeon]
MIIRIQKKLVLFLVIALIVISTPIVVSKTGNYFRRSDEYKTTDVVGNDNYRPSERSCGSNSNCGCGCGGPGTASPRTKVDIEQTGDKIRDAENAGYRYYVDNYGDTEVEAVAKDYGYHVEVQIIKDGHVLKKFGYSDGSVYE